MKFEKKEPEIRIQPYREKNPWVKRQCRTCQAFYDGGSYRDDKGRLHFDWCGQSLTGEHIWECAKCLYLDALKNGKFDEDEDDQ